VTATETGIEIETESATETETETARGIVTEKGIAIETRIGTGGADEREVSLPGESVATEAAVGGGAGAVVGDETNGWAIPDIDTSSGRVISHPLDARHGVMY
jgi:hypothetical protein